MQNFIPHIIEIKLTRIKK